MNSFGDDNSGGSDLKKSNITVDASTSVQGRAHTQLCCSIYIYSNKERKYINSEVKFDRCLGLLHIQLHDEPSYLKQQHFVPKPT